MSKSRIGLTALFFLIININTGGAYSQNTRTNPCLACHDDKSSYESSVHKDINCSDCHADKSKYPHPPAAEKVNCAVCHENESVEYQTSDHGKAMTGQLENKQFCAACHGDPHSILPQTDKSSSTNRKNISKTCASCHDNQEWMKVHHMSIVEPYKSYSASIHGLVQAEGGTQAAACTDCHGSHNNLSPLNPESKIYKFNIPTTCGNCHKEEYNVYLTSVHAKALYAGNKDAPVCTDCHGEHTIERPSTLGGSVYPTSIAKTCGNCHASERITSKYGLPKGVLSTYKESYHGLAEQYGSLEAANCASCHGYHYILPSTDPRSSIYPSNIGKTCSKCHPNAGSLAGVGSVHIRPSIDRDRAIYYVTLFYVALIILVVGGMLFHNLLDLKEKLFLHYKIELAKTLPEKMNLNDRIWHLVLLITFILLVYTGFSHKYPEAFFSYPFHHFGKNGAFVRKWIHRGAGIIFIFSMLYHALYLATTKHGREKVKLLIPKLRDVKDAFGTFLYYLGFKNVRPVLASYSYIEKAEYWALIWGSVVMIITGAALMFENISLQFMPKWLIDVLLLIHFFEAILALMAIIVWHFYWTIFDPKVYPMSWTWITGKGDSERI